DHREPEVVEDLSDVGAEAVEVCGEIEFDVLRVLCEPLQAEVGYVVEVQVACCLEEHTIKVLVIQLVLEVIALRLHCLAVRVEDAVQAAQYDEGERYIAVLVRLEGATQDVVSNLP